MANAPRPAASYRGARRNAMRAIGEIRYWRDAASRRPKLRLKRELHANRNRWNMGLSYLSLGVREQRDASPEHVARLHRKIAAMGTTI